MRGRPFLKGTSGNPAGRPPSGRSLAEYIRALSGEDGGSTPTASTQWPRPRTSPPGCVSLRSPCCSIGGSARRRNRLPLMCHARWSFGGKAMTSSAGSNPQREPLTVGPCHWRDSSTGELPEAGRAHRRRHKRPLGTRFRAERPVSCSVNTPFFSAKS